MAPGRPDIALALDGGIRELVRSMASAVLVVTIHTERLVPRVCYIGAVSKAGRHRLHLIEVDPDGRWRKRPRSYRWERISRVDVGGTYEANLIRVAGPRA